MQTGDMIGNTGKLIERMGEIAEGPVTAPNAVAESVII